MALFRHETTGFFVYYVNRRDKPYSKETNLETNLQAEPATWSWTGTDAELDKSTVINSEPAAWAWTGADAGLDKATLVNAEPAAWAWTGTDASFVYNKAIHAEPVSWAWTGADAGFLANISFQADPAIWGWTGADAGLNKANLFNAEPATWAWTGADAGLLASRAINAEPASWAWTGTEAGLAYARLFNAEPTAWVWTGADATYTSTGVISDALGFAAIQSKTANQSTFTHTTNAEIPAGNFAILGIAFDNHQTTDGDEGGVTGIDDQNGNTWYKAAEYCNGQGAAQAGVTVSQWYCNVETTIPSSTGIVVSLSNNTSRDAVCSISRQFTKGDGKILVPVDTATEAVDAGDPGSLDVTTENLQHLRVRMVGGEIATTTSLTGTSGWSGFVGTNTTGGASDTNITLRGEFRVNTATGAASNPTWVSCDNASVYVAYKETDQVTNLQADPTSWAWTGADAGLAYARLFNAESAAWAWTGADAGLVPDQGESADPAAWSWTGTEANLVKIAATAKQINAVPASWSWQFYPTGPYRETRTSTQVEYHPGPVPYDVAMLPQYLLMELAKIQAAISRIRDEKQDV